MRNAMRTIGKVYFLVFVMVAPALAQNQMVTRRRPQSPGQLSI